jgi:hypothetical protein
MKTINKYVDERARDITEKFEHEKHSVEEYIKAASFLSFSERGDAAVELLSSGLVHYPKNEEMIGAIFSFMCQNYNVLQALDFAEGYKDIFAIDEFSNIRKAMDLVRLSFSFGTPEKLSKKQIAELDQIIHMYSEENTYDVPMVTIGIMDEYHLPFVGLGIAKALADVGDDFAQMVLGGTYLKGYHVEKDLLKAKHYLNLSSQQGNKDAVSLLEKVNTKSNLN